MKASRTSVPANSQLGKAQQALSKAQREVELAAEEADKQPRLEAALGEIAEAIEEHQAAISTAVAQDEQDAEDSGAAEAERRGWAPARPVVI